MPPQTSLTATPLQLLGMTNGLVIHQALYAPAKLGVADLLKGGAQTSSDLARKLNVNESALYRILRLMASQSVFEATSPRTFENTGLSHFLCTGVPGSVRSILIFRGSEFLFGPFAEMLYSIETGLPARAKLFGMETFEYFSAKRESILVRSEQSAMQTSSTTAPLAMNAPTQHDREQEALDERSISGAVCAVEGDSTSGTKQIRAANKPNRFRRNALLD
jgi:hypothetical protein